MGGVQAGVQHGVQNHVALFHLELLSRAIQSIELHGVRSAALYEHPQLKMEPWIEPCRVRSVDHPRRILHPKHMAYNYHWLGDSLVDACSAQLRGIGFPCCVNTEGRPTASAVQQRADETKQMLYVIDCRVRTYA